jgi:CheY-like chemotaxis protein
MTSQNSRSQKTRVLIVDDDQDFTEALALGLRQLGTFETRAENRPDHALACAQDFEPDAILLDVVMPQADGGDVAACLATDETTRSIPIMYLTSLLGVDEVPLGGLVSGGRRFFPKPGSLVELAQCIHSAVQERNGRQSAVA